MFDTASIQDWLDNTTPDVASAVENPVLNPWANLNPWENDTRQMSIQCDQMLLDGLGNMPDVASAVEIGRMSFNKNNYNYYEPSQLSTNPLVIPPLQQISASEIYRYERAYADTTDDAALLNQLQDVSLAGYSSLALPGDVDASLLLPFLRG